MSDIKERLAKHGYSLDHKLGSGTYGTAYDIGNDRVLKITKDESEANSSTVIQKHPHKNIVQIYKVFKLKNVDYLWFIEQEKLKHIDEDKIEQYLEDKRSYENRSIGGTLQKLLTYISDTAYFNSHFHSLLQTDAEKLIDMIVKREMSYISADRFYGSFMRHKMKSDEYNFIIDMFDAAKHLEKVGISFRDWHEGNILWKDGNYKITDLGVSKSTGKVTDILEQFKLKTLLN